MSDPIIVDIYCRVSVSSEEGNSHLDEQEQICREYCAAQGLTVSTVYREVFSGSQLKGRPVFNYMRSRYLDGTIQAVVVTTLDRLSRSNAHLVLLINEMEAHHVILYVVQDQLEDSLQGKWLLALSAFLTTAEQEKMLEL